MGVFHRHEERVLGAIDHDDADLRGNIRGPPRLLRELYCIVMYRSRWRTDDALEYRDPFVIPRFVMRGLDRASIRKKASLLKSDGLPGPGYAKASPGASHAGPPML
jgi:hypothetical protein